MLVTRCVSQFFFVIVVASTVFIHFLMLQLSANVTEPSLELTRKKHRVSCFSSAAKPRESIMKIPSISIKMHNIRWLWAKTQAVLFLYSTRMGSMILTKKEKKFYNKILEHFLAIGNVFWPYSISNQHYTWPQTSVPILETSNPCDSGGDPPAAALHWGSHCVTPKSAC